MGGTVEQITKSNNISDTINDLNSVSCLVDIALDGNNALFNREILYKKFTNEISQIFNGYGVRHKIEPLPGLGGGGFESLLIIIKDLWNQYNFLIFLLSVIRFIITHYTRIASFKLFYKKDITKPRLKIFLWIESARQIDNDDIKFIKSNFIKRLQNLNILSENLFLEMFKKYPTFYFDREISGSLCRLGFKVSYDIPHERNNRFNFHRMKNLIQSLNIVKNRYCSYYFPNLIFITRTQQEQTYSQLFGGTFQRIGKVKKYYFLLSNKVVSDYLSL